MKRGWIPIMGVCLVLSFSACKQLLPYQDTSLTAEQRAEDLLPRLTLEEKVSLMQNASPAIPRLGIKEYEWWNEALHGVGRAGLATVFPQSIGMGASFNDSLLYEVFNATSDEARVKSRIFGESGALKRYQGLTFWTPNVNIFRDPRWGRGQETYGEDPYLTGQMGMAVVRGLQGPEDTKYDKLHACAKHFAVHSGPEWNRHSFDAENIDPRDLWETYLPAFKDLVQKAHVKEVMCAYNRFEGEPCCGSNRLLMQILRDEWGYKGIVVKPTMTGSVELGFELRFLENRIGLDFTYYNQHSKDQILRMNTSYASSYNYQLINAGDIENKGVEIVLNTRPIELKDFSWDLNLNFAKNSNKVKELANGIDEFELASARWLGVKVVAKVGENYGCIMGKDFLRNENGDIIIDGTSGLPKMTDDLKVLGNASWDWTGGITTNLRYKNFSLGAIFDVKVGADLYSMSARSAYATGKHKDTLEGRDAWYQSEEKRLEAGVTPAARKAT